MDGDCGHPGYDVWIAQHFHDCVYNIRDYVGFVLGLAAILLWITAQLPQFYQNYVRKSAEVLSPWFLAQWLLGDTTNLLGCLLQGDQLPTTTFTAMYFVFSDMLMMVQYIYYIALQRRRERLRQLRANRRHRHHRHLHVKRYDADDDGGGGAAGDAPAHDAAARSSDLESPAVLEGQDSNTASAAVVIGAAGLTPQAAARHRLLPSPAVSLLAMGAAATLVSAALVLTSNVSGTGAEAAARRRSMLVSPTVVPSISVGSLAPPSAVELHTGGVGAAAAVAGPDIDWTQLAGTALGWCSSILYLMSRVSQIVRNARRKDTEGLAVTMFMCAVSANLCTGSSIMLRTFDWQQLVQQAPWLVGSLGTIALDMVILSQSFRYGHAKAHTPPPARDGLHRQHHAGHRHRQPLEGAGEGGSSDAAEGQPLLPGEPQAVRT